jgi:hypothetical protein
VVQCADKQSAGIVQPALPYSTLQCSRKVLTWKVSAERRRRRTSNEGESKQERRQQGVKDPVKNLANVCVLHVRRAAGSGLS